LQDGDITHFVNNAKEAISRLELRIANVKEVEGTLPVAEERA
jgi:hypothetical protein